MTRLIQIFFTCPVAALCAMAGISAAAIVAALIGQYGFNLHPCHLCILQRIPYFVVIGMSLIGVVLTRQYGVKIGAIVIALCAVAFFINSGIAVYHVGVEQKWWASAACSVPDMASLSFEELQERIYNAPSVSCDAIAWKLFGISMAGYNVILCAMLGIYGLLASIFVTRKANGF